MNPSRNFFEIGGVSRKRKLERDTRFRVKVANITMEGYGIVYIYETSAMWHKFGGDQVEPPP